MGRYKNAVSAERFGGTALIRFDRPKARNPLSSAVLDLLLARFDGMSSDPSIDSIVFAGSGNTFASGADLTEISRLDPESALEFSRRGQRLIRKIFNSRKTTVAAISGFCIGGALDLALSCRKRIASPDSQFGHPGAKLGIITGWGGTRLLPRLIGRKRAYDMFLTAKRIGAAEALEIGLIDAVDDDPVEFALQMER